MKICPVCQSRAFDDAVVCYGCMHRFEKGMGNTASAAPEVPDVALKKTTPPAFSIRFTPKAAESGGVVWNCAVEVA